MRTRVVLAVGVLALAIGGCGGDDDDDVSEDEQPYVDAFVASASDADEDELQLSGEQAECFGARFVDIVGVDRLEEAGVTPEDFGDDSSLDFSEIGLSEDEGEDIYDSFEECDVDIRAEFLNSLDADGSLTEEDRECVEDAFDEDLIRRMLVTTFVQGEDALEQDEELMSDVFAVFSECPGAAPG